MDKKKYAMIANIILLIWYFLAMTGVKIGSKYLVEGAFRDEWIFMAIPLVTFLLFVFAGKIGKYIHLRWNLSRGFSAKHNVSENSVQNICRAVSPQRMRIIGSMVFFYL